MNPPIIRLATPEDLHAIYAIETSAFPPHRQATLEMLKRRLELFPEGCFALEEEGKIIGASISFPTNDNKTFESIDIADSELFNPKGPIYWFRKLAIHPDHQRKGYGSLLIKKQIENAKNLGKTSIRFTAREKNAPFYEKQGFTRITNYESFHNAKQAMWELKIAPQQD